MFLAPLTPLPRVPCRCGTAAVYVLREGAEPRGHYCRACGWRAMGVHRSAHMLPCETGPSVTLTPEIDHALDVLVTANGERWALEALQATLPPRRRRAVGRSSSWSL
jgi:hypothetical protein